MDKKRNWSISDIESITEDKAKAMAIEMMEIKEHNIYFVDFEDAFGYSCLVYKNNHHIYYANDYQMHHSRENTIEELKRVYIEKMNDILFTEAEIAKPLKDYDEYRRKNYYLHNYYGMQVDSISAIHINPTEEFKAAFREQTKDMYYNPVSFSYMSDPDFVEHHVNLLATLKKMNKAVSSDYVYLKNAFLYEMYNHEYGINWQADYDVLSCFGNVQYHGESTEALKSYFTELHFTDEQRKAYMDARSQYFKKTNCW